MWVAYKRVELYGIRLHAGDIDLTIQWYEKTTGISVSDPIYRLYFDKPPQVQRHTQLVKGKISMAQISRTVERHISVINESPSP